MGKLLFIYILFSSISVSATTFYAKDFGVKGDGITDDGPAIRRAIEAISITSGERTLIFEKGETYYIKNLNEAYLFNLKALSDITIDGGNSFFLLEGNVRFISLELSRNIIVNNLSIDYKPLPFADGLVIAKNQAEGFVDVKISDEFEIPPYGGPTHEPNEQAYFGMLWNDGPYSLLGTHYWVQDIRESQPGSSAQRIVRVASTPDFTEWNVITTNVTKISIPVRGIAHMGPDEVVRIVESENVYFNNVNVWSAPWFAIGLARNKGEVTFKHVNIQPKPGTGRLTSSWRDGFHVSSNYAKLLWEDCHIEGTNDDAFNIQSFTSTLLEVKSDNEITIRQNYPLSIVPYNPGDVIVVYDVVNGKILGKTKAASISGFAQTGTVPAPEITLVMDKPISGMSRDCQVWNESSANPNTTLRRCQIFSSCRFQSSLIIDDCDIKALSWFYGDNIEGPIPSNILIKNSRLFLGRGNAAIAVAFSSNMTKDGVPYSSKEQVISNIILQNNLIDGELRIEHTDKVSLLNNKFLLPRSKLFLGNSRHIFLRDNLLGNSKIDAPNLINFQDDESKASTTIWLNSPNDPPWLQPYNPDILTPWNDYYGQRMDDFYWVMTQQYSQLFMYKELFQNSYLREYQSDSIFVVKDSSIDYYGTAKPHMKPVLVVPQGFISNFKGTVINENLDSIGSIPPARVSENSGNMKVYPNPSHDNITIKFDNILSEQGIIQLYDIQGKLLQQQKIDTPGNVIISKISWNITFLFPGMYFLKMAGGPSLAVKFIKE